MHLAAAGPYRRGDREADEAGPNDDSALRANRSGYEVTAVSCGAQIVHMWEGGAGNIEMNRARTSGEEERIVGAAAAVRQNHLSYGRAEYSDRTKVEAGMVPWQSDRLFADKTVNTWRAVMRADRTNRTKPHGEPQKPGG